jgi:hypothetical protein
MLPNFFVAGCQKCATTSLHYYLVQHPDIYLPSQKESKHFVINDRFSKGLSYYEKYYFGAVNRERAIGEVDPEYIYFEEALNRIKLNFKIDKLKFIFIFRNPVDRAFSHYLMTYRRGIETKSFINAITCERERIESGFNSKMHFSYIDRGFYYSQLSPFIEVLRPEQVLYLLTDDLKHDTNSTLKKCFEFLGVDNNFTPLRSNIKYHRATIPRSNLLLNEIVGKKDTLPKKILRLLIPNQNLRHKIRKKILYLNQTSNLKRICLQASERIQLIEIYRNENHKLGQLIERDLTHWNKVS